MIIFNNVFIMNILLNILHLLSNFSSDTCLPFSETPDQPGDYSGDTR